MPAAVASQKPVRAVKKTDTCLAFSRSCPSIVLLLWREHPDAMTRHVVLVFPSLLCLPIGYLPASDRELLAPGRQWAGCKRGNLPTEKGETDRYGNTGWDTDLGQCERNPAHER